MSIFGKKNTDSESDFDDEPVTKKMDRSMSTEPPTTPLMGGPDGFDNMTDPMQAFDAPIVDNDFFDKEEEDPRTRVMFPSRQEAQKTVEDEDDKAMDDPVVGWVVIVKGPGQGHSCHLGYGMNAIGRATTQRVSLDYGDGDMSRDKHAIITYDPRGKKFYVQHGGGQNLTYLEAGPVLMPTELKGGEEIIVGQTTLRFIPFCGEKFDWQDQGKN